jgi:hypothetical protein
MSSGKDTDVTLEVTVGKAGVSCYRTAPADWKREQGYYVGKNININIVMTAICPATHINPEVIKCNGVK